MTDDRQDLDPVETQQWLGTVEDVIDRNGGKRAQYFRDCFKIPVIGIITDLMPPKKRK